YQLAHTPHLEWRIGIWGDFEISFTRQGNDSLVFAENRGIGQRRCCVEPNAGTIGERHLIGSTVRRRQSEFMYVSWVQGSNCDGFPFIHDAVMIHYNSRLSFTQIDGFSI